MKFDVFFSLCQANVDGYLPSERVMFENFFDQVRLADALGFDVAWVAESHLSISTERWVLILIFSNSLTKSLAKLVVLKSALRFAIYSATVGHWLTPKASACFSLCMG